MTLLADEARPTEVADRSGDAKVLDGRWAVVPVLLVGFTLRALDLDHFGLWIDEAFSVRLAQRGPADILAGTAVDQHPPLYYLLLWGWMHLTGLSDFAIRFLSVSFGVLTLAVTYRLGRDWLGPRGALLAVTLLAVAPFHIRYSQEARMYVFLGCWGMLLALVAFRLLRGPSHRGLPWALTALTAAALYTHYFAGFVVVGQALVLGALSLSRTAGAAPRRGLAHLALGGVLFLPWLPVFLAQVSNHAMPWLAKPTPRTLAESLLYAAVGSKVVHPGGLLALAGLAAVSLAHSGPRLLARVRRPMPWPARPELWLLAGLAIPLGAIWLAATRQNIYHDKQLLFLAPWIALALAAWAAGQRRLLLSLPLAALLVALPIQVLATQGAVPVKQDWRGLAQHIDATGGPRDVVFLNPAAGRLGLEHYLRRPVALTGYPFEYDLIATGGFRGEQVRAETLHPYLEALASRYDRVWLVEFSAIYWDPDRMIQGWLNENLPSSQAMGFAGLEVRVYSREVER